MQLFCRIPESSCEWFAFSSWSLEGLIASTSAHSAEASKETITFRDPQDHRIFEQSLTDIWAAICFCSNEVIRTSGVDPKEVKGVGFDATCSLAVTDLDGNPAEVSKGPDLGLAKEWTAEDVGKDKSMILWAGTAALSIGWRGRGRSGLTGLSFAIDRP